MASWPAAPFPQKPLYSGNTETLADTVIRTEMSTGPAKVRRRFTSGVRFAHYELLLKLADLATFRTFFESTCSGGAVSWTWTHPVDGGAITCRFVGQPTYTMVSSGRVRVGFDCEVLP